MSARQDGDMTMSAFEVTDPSLPVLALDIGGTKMAAGLVTSDGDVLAVERTPSPARGSAEEMYGALTGLCDSLFAATGQQEVAGVGVGCAGPMVWPDGVVSPVNIPGWRGYPLRRNLAKRFPGVPVRIHNDAIAMAAAEHWMGAAAGYANALGMVVSTGVGGGLIIDDQIVNGGLGNAGHIGHVVVNPEGPACGCGGRGCLEAIARGPATAAWAVEQGWTPRRADAPADAKTLAEDARNGDPIGIAAYRRAGEAVGIALASVAALLDLDIAVIGGGLVQSGDLLMVPMRHAFEEHAGMAFVQRMTIVPAVLDQLAGVVGAAALVVRGDAYWTQPDA